MPTPDRHVYVVGEEGQSFRLLQNVDLSGQAAAGDSIIGVLPDWSGRLWFASRHGVVGTLDLLTGRVGVLQLEPVGNSFAVGERGGVYVVTDGALYRLVAGPHGVPAVDWRAPYDNGGVRKPGADRGGLRHNYGYSGPAATENGATTTGGLERVVVSRDLKRCRVVWHSGEIAPSAVPKVSLPNGLVYTYTKPASSDGDRGT